MKYIEDLEKTWQESKSALSPADYLIEKVPPLSGNFEPIFRVFPEKDIRGVSYLRFKFAQLPTYELDLNITTRAITPSSGLIDMLDLAKDLETLLSEIEYKTHRERVETESDMEYFKELLPLFAEGKVVANEYNRFDPSQANERIELLSLAARIRAKMDDLEKKQRDLEREVIPFKLIISLWDKSQDKRNYIQGHPPLDYYLYPMGSLFQAGERNDNLSAMV